MKEATAKESSSYDSKENATCIMRFKVGSIKMVTVSR